MDSAGWSMKATIAVIVTVALHSTTTTSTTTATTTSGRDPSGH